MAEVEFAVVVEEGFEVFLDDVGFGLAVLVELLVSHQSLYLHRRSHTNPHPTIRILPWLHNPYPIHLLTLLLFKLPNPHTILLPGHYVIRVW